MMGIICFGSKDEGCAATRCIGNLSTGTRSLPGSAFAFFMVMVINEARMCCLPCCRRGGCVWAATRVHSIQGTAHESLKSLAGFTLFNLQFLLGRKRSGALYGVMGFPSDSGPCKVIVSINASRIYRSRSYMYNVSAYRNRSLSFFFGNYSVRDDPVAQVCIGIGMVITPGRGI